MEGLTKLGASILLLAVLSGCTTALPAPSGTASIGPLPPTDSGAPPPAESASPEQPSRQSLIADALAGGQIDEVTSLVYRGQALFDLPQLPAEFTGAPSLFEDTALFNQIVDLMPTLPPDDQARLRPFIARPTEADSIFASGGLPAAGRRSDLLAAGFVTAQSSPAEECRTWVDSAALSSHFKVWACASADSAADQSAVTSVATFLDGLWPTMTAAVPTGMGVPLADGRGPDPGPEFGGDGRIDVYLLTLNQAVFRAGHLEKLPGGKGAAAALPSEPYNENRASGFLMVNRLRLSEGDEWHNDVIHEFFHVLQYAHNRRAWLSGTSQQWFVEASATWAETYYGTSSLVHGWLHDFQVSPLGLEASDPPEHGYSAYMWPLFMQQETGSADAIFKAWQQIETVGAGDFKGVSDAIDAQLKFGERFRDFAVRNLNKDILTEVTKPGPEKRYQQLDPTIPDYFPAPIENVSIEPGATKRSGELSIPPLGARYVYFAVGPLSRSVTIDLSELSPPELLDADVLAYVKDHWERRPVEGGKFMFCRDVAEDDIDQLYLVLSNHSRDENATINGTVVSKAEPCSGWAGTMTGTRTWIYSPGTIAEESGTATTTFTGIWTLDTNPRHYPILCTVDLGGTSPPDCPQIYLPTGTISWSLDARAMDPNGPICTDARSGTLPAASYSDPERDWSRQALYLHLNADQTKFEYYGQGGFDIADFEKKCAAGESYARYHTPFFAIIEDAAQRQPSSGAIETCIGRAWEIDVAATTITDSCHYRSPGGEYDEVYTWNLQRVGDEGGG